MGFKNTDDASGIQTAAATFKRTLSLRHYSAYRDTLENDRALAVKTGLEWAIRKTNAKLAIFDRACMGERIDLDLIEAANG